MGFLSLKRTTKTQTSKSKFSESPQNKNEGNNQNYTCKNSECESVFNTPLMIEFANTEKIRQTFGCPQCLTEVETTPPEPPKQEPTPPEPPKQEPTPIDGCHLGFGYLATKPKGQPIPDGCITCEKSLDCMLLKTNKKKENRFVSFFS